MMKRWLRLHNVCPRETRINLPAARSIHNRARWQLVFFSHDMHYLTSTTYNYRIPAPRRGRISPTGFHPRAAEHTMRTTSSAHHDWSRRERLRTPARRPALTPARTFYCTRYGPLRAGHDPTDLSLCVRSAPRSAHFGPGRSAERGGGQPGRRGLVWTAERRCFARALRAS